MTCRLTPAKAIENTSSGLTQALEEGNAETAMGLIEAYGRDVAEQLCAATSPKQREMVADEALSFLQDRLHLARVMRAHFAAQIASISQQISYTDRSASNTTWQMDG